MEFNHLKVICLRNIYNQVNPILSTPLQPTDHRNKTGYNSYSFTSIELNVAESHFQYECSMIEQELAFLHKIMQIIFQGLTKRRRNGKRAPNSFDGITLNHLFRHADVSCVLRQTKEVFSRHTNSVHTNIQFTTYDKLLACFTWK